MKARLLSLLLAGLALPPIAAFASQISVSTGDPSGYGVLTSNYTPGGLSNFFALEAQPFVAPDATHLQLDEFSFFYVPNPGYATNSLQTFIVEWDLSGARSIGSPLWSSSAGSTTISTFSTPAPSNPFGGTDWTRYTFSTGGLVLDPLKSYAWVLEQNATSHPGDQQPGAFAFSALAADAAFGGKAYWTGTPWSYTDLASTSWGGTANYLAYSAQFSSTAVPDHLPAALLPLGLVALGVAAHRRRRLA